MIKQFNQTGSTDIEKLKKFEPPTPSPQHNFMREEDDKKIKSYVKYENLAVSKQNVLNNLLSAAGNTDSSTSADEGEDEEVTDASSISQSKVSKLETVQENVSLEVSEK